MPTKSAVEAAIGADDELGEELLESLRDTGMYNFASEFDVMQEHMGTPDDVPGPSGLDTELAFNDEGGHVLGDLPSSAMKAAGEPIVARLDNEIVGKAAVTAATEAVNHARQRIDMVSSESGLDGSGAGDPSSPPRASARASAGGAVTPTPEPNSAAKRRRISAGATGGSTPGPSTAGLGTAEKEKGGKGLRHFSMKVCEKVESKGTTTYNEVADELVAEFSKPDDPRFCADQAYDEKNIRRRVYDALNVLMAMDIISKEKKEITWKGLPATAKQDDMEALRAEKARAQASIEKKNAYLLELVEQYKSYQALLQRNAARAAAGVVPSGIQLPFILVQTKPNATVEVEISEDQQIVHFDFNSTPFQIHDGNFVLAQMNLTENSMANLNLNTEVKAEPINGHGLNGGDDALVGELVGGPSAHGSPKGKVKGKAKGEATEPEVKIEGGRRGKKK